MTQVRPIFLEQDELFSTTLKKTFLSHYAMEFQSKEIRTQNNFKDRAAAQESEHLLCLQSTLLVALAPPHANQAKQLSKLWSPMARHGKGSASNVLEVQFVHKSMKHMNSSQIMLG
jgi:hypothetical protein